MKKIIAPFAILAFLLNSFFATAAFAQEAGDDSDELPATVTEVTSTSTALFTDISVSHPNYDAIFLLKNEGVLEGYPDGSFKPDQQINRVEALKLIMEIADLTSGQVAAAEFSDTEKNAWYSGYLNRAVFKEIVSGYPDGSFKPSQTVNLVEFLKMLINSERFDLSVLNLNQIPYADAIPGQWYFKYLVFAKKHTLVDIDNQNKVYPDQPITRAKAAEIIFRIKKLTLEQAPRLESSDDGNTGNPIDPEMPELGNNMALFVSESYKFGIQYPELWFYSTAANTNELAIRTYGFGPDDLTSNPAEINLELLPLSTEVQNNADFDGLTYQRETVDGKLHLTLKLADASRVYRLIGAIDQENLILSLLNTITEDVEGLESYNPSEKPAEETTETPTDQTPAA